MSPASRISVKVSLELLWKIEEAKGEISKEIILTGEPLRDDVCLLITIKEVTPLTALRGIISQTKGIIDVQGFQRLFG